MKWLPSWMSPLSNTSSSGFTPASAISCAMIARFAGVLMTTEEPEYIVFRSRLHSSGRSAWTCATRGSGRISVVPGAATRGSASLGTKRWPGPVVRLMTMSSSAARRRSTTSR